MANAGAQALLDGVAEHLLAAAAQRVPDHAPSRGHGAAHREPRRVGAQPPRHVGSSGRDHPRPPACASCSTRCARYPNVAALDATWRTRSAPPAVLVPLRLRVGDHGAVVVLDEHVDRHAGRHHARRAPRRAVPPRRRGDGGDGRRPPNALACTVMERLRHARADRGGGCRDRRRDRGAVAAPGRRAGERRPSAVGLAVQRAVVEPADPAAAPPSLGLGGDGRRADHRVRGRGDVPRRHDGRAASTGSSPTTSTSTSASRSAPCPGRPARCAAAWAPSTTSTSARSRPAGSTRATSGRSCAPSRTATPTRRR